MNELIGSGQKVDLILTDPPYGTIKGLNLDGYKNRDISWDERLPIKEMFSCCEKLLRKNGIIILFSQEPYTSYLRQYKFRNISFIYPYIWLKDHFANPFMSKKAPVSYFEDVSVFRKNYDMELVNPLRSYAQQVLSYIKNETGLNRKEIEDCVEGNLNHFFSNSGRFHICTEETYDKLIYIFHIDNYKLFKPYEDMKKIHKTFLKNNEKIFNLETNTTHKSNVLKYKKSYNHYHPTEKPVDLLKDLILTYTNKGDTVLDFTMGSGSTGVACLQTNRNFIGIELEEKYYNIAKKRCSNYQSKLW